MMTIFTKNLKRFRMAKNMTQEQAADALGVSAQTISRWECNTTLPDVATLPQIARLYGVTVDDLYKETSVAYEHYASRLLSVYESTRRPEDFIQADLEYRKLLKNNTATTEDLRSYGILHQFMMIYCRDKALSLFDNVLKQGPGADEETYWSTARQKLLFYSQIGRNDESIAERKDAVSSNSCDVNNWICLIAAYNHAGRHQEAEEWIRKAIEQFPNNACLCVYCGDVYKNLKKYDDAFAYWDKAIDLDPTLTDAQFSKGFCYEELGEYKKACEIWCQLADDLGNQGYDIEMAYPQQRADICREKLRGK